MGSATGWKLATAALSLTTMGLAAALLTRPEPETRVETVYVRTTTDEPTPRNPEERDRRRVSTQRPAPRTDVIDVSDAPTEDRRAETERDRLARLDIDEVCRTELLSGGSAPASVVVERLLLDRARATELMLAWYAKRNDPKWKELGIALAPHFYETFLAVVGDAAAGPLRDEWLETRRPEPMATLVRYGDAETLRSIDEDHRSPHPRRQINPYLLVTLGEPARAMVWGWIDDPSVDKSVRTTAIAGMWARGTDADRRRLWAEMDDTVRVLHFAPHAIRDDNDWSARLRSRVEAMLVDSDHWVRLHGSRAALQNRFEWGDELARRAAGIATEDARLPKPGGRDEHDWSELLRWIALHRTRLPAVPRDDDAVREALGLK